MFSYWSLVIDSAESHPESELICSSIGTIISSPVCNTLTSACGSVHANSTYIDMYLTLDYFYQHEMHAVWGQKNKLLLSPIEDDYENHFLSQKWKKILPKVLFLLTC